MPRPLTASVLALLASVALGGCVGELLTEEEATVRTFACAVLDETDARPVLLGLHRERGVQRVPVGALGALADHLADAGFAARDRYAVVESTLLEEPGPWTPEVLQAWAQEAVVLDAEAVRLHVLWVDDFADGEGTTVLHVAPGVVAVSETAVQEGAERLGRSEDFLARVLLYHVVGHALGAVNQGIPLNGTDPTSQEGMPGHESSPESVMHHGWERVTTLPRTDAPYDAYSGDVLDDWRAAVAPTGVCA